MTESKSVALPLGYTPLIKASGEPIGIRTLDTRLRRPLLYPAELRAHAYLKNGAEDEIRTRDPRLGKAMLYP